jgi:hypothetical protein
VAKWVSVLLLVGSCAGKPTVESSSTEATVVAIPRASVWNYWDKGGDLGTSWSGLAFDDSAWASGAGPLGYGESYVSTVISYGPSASDKYITSYFRRTFNVDDPAAVTAISGEIMFDDGVVVYINGTRIGRASMPSGDYDASTLAFGHEIGNAYQPYTWTQQKSLLVAGTNVMAVEVHQHASSSSDLTFDLSLTIEAEAAPPPPPAGEDIPRRSVWSYWDGVEAPSAYDSWANPDYDDSAWSSGPGPLGYGESYVATPISYGDSAGNKTTTAYFRRWFTVDEPSFETRLIAELMYDDGVVVHINGYEVARRHMPTGYIDHTTLSTGHESGNNYETYEWSAFNYLVPGLNVIAVEVHQTSLSSSDLTFDLALRVETPVTCGIPGCGPTQAPRSNASLAGVWVGPDAVWVAGGDTWQEGNPAVIGRRLEADGTWCWCAPDPEVTLVAVWGTADDDVWFVGRTDTDTDGRVYHYDGASLASVDVGSVPPLRAIWGSGPNDIFIVGSDGAIRHFDGASWTAHDLGPDQTLMSVWGASAADVWVTGTEPAPYPDPEYPEFDGSSGIIYRWQPATGTWVLEHKTTMYYGGAYYTSIHGTDADNVWAVGADHPAGAACSISRGDHYDGTTWSHAVPYPYAECVGFTDVLAGAPGVEDGVWMFGRNDSGGAVRYSGGVWSVDPSEASEDLVDADYRGSKLWAVGGQKIVQWNGTTWVRDR